MMISEIIGLAQRILEHEVPLSAANAKTMEVIFDEYLTAIDGELSLRLGGVPVNQFDPHYLECRAKVSADIKHILARDFKDREALQWLREDLTRLDNHLVQASVRED